mmetsp:Transcript_29939/g.96069  ORF Transcript_29939/g.96069 Transcript_29939/m.96069 type:complete len:461 (-) Transcript_29939:20-1402(-)
MQHETTSTKLLPFCLPFSRRKALHPGDAAELGSNPPLAQRLGRRVEHPVPAALVLAVLVPAYLALGHVEVAPVLHLGKVPHPPRAVHALHRAPPPEAAEDVHTCRHPAVLVRHDLLPLPRGRPPAHQRLAPLLLVDLQLPGVPPFLRLHGPFHGGGAGPRGAGGARARALPALGSLVGGLVLPVLVVRVLRVQRERLPICVGALPVALELKESAGTPAVRLGPRVIRGNGEVGVGECALVFPEGHEGGRAIPEGARVAWHALDGAVVIVDRLCEPSKLKGIVALLAPGLCALRRGHRLRGRTDLALEPAPRGRGLEPAGRVPYQLDHLHARFDRGLVEGQAQPAVDERLVFHGNARHLLQLSLETRHGVVVLLELDLQHGVGPPELPPHHVDRDPFASIGLGYRGPARKERGQVAEVNLAHPEEGARGRPKSLSLRDGRRNALVMFEASSSIFIASFGGP